MQVVGIGGNDVNYYINKGDIIVFKSSNWKMGLSLCETMVPVTTPLD